MKRFFAILLAVACLLVTVPASATDGEDVVSESATGEIETIEAASDCTHEQRSVVHISGTIYLVCETCGEIVTEAGYCMSCDQDHDGFCDDCGYDVRFAPWDGTFCESIEEAAAAMRMLLKSRESAYIFFEVTEEEYNNSVFYERFNDIVFKHTGVFDEGDYLSASFVTIGYSSEHVQYGDEYYLGYTPHQLVSATTAEQELELYRKVDDVIEENGWLDLSGVDQIKAVYDWVCENVAYDHEHYEACSADPFCHYQDLAIPIQPSYMPHCAYGAIFDGKSVCSGYSQLLYAFYNKLGVDCRMVSGTGNGEPHDWNIVELDGIYYFVDATWDAALLQAGQEYAYFLKSKANMTGHIADDDVLCEYELAKHDYGYASGDESEIVESGTMDGVEWRLMGDGTLIFSGAGTILRNPVSDISLIEKVVIGDGISAIGSIDFENWVNGYSYAVFNDCTNLESVEFGTGLTTIGDEVFRQCESLTEITIPDNVTDIGYGAFRYCKNLKSVSLPITLEILRSSLFSGCYKLADVKIPDSVTEIENYVFDHCQSLASVALPSGLERLGARVFYECSSLEAISIPSGVKELETELFYNCTELTSVLLNEGLEKLGKGIFYGCKNLTEISLPSTVTTVGGYCFTLTAIKSIDLPDSITEIPEHLFESCEYLESVVIPENVTKIGMYAFTGCTALEELELPDGITEIGQAAFAECDSLRVVNIPSSLMEIPYSCFYGCESLTNIVIPGDVACIGEQAFAQCSNLVRITFCGDAPEFSFAEGDNSSAAFWGVTAIIYYPEGNATWKDDVMQSYGGSIIWAASPSGHIHNYKVAVIAPSCTTDGYTAYTCSCGDGYTTDQSATFGHDRSAGLCTVCGEDSVAALLNGSILTITGELTVGTRIIAAVYNNDGRFLWARLLIWQGVPLAEDIPVDGRTALFFADSNWLPLRPPITLK